MKTNNPVAIVWFRQDLRIEDNPALNKALENYQEIIPLFIEKSPKEKLEWDYGGASKWWLHHSLAALKKELKTLHLDLILKIGDPFEVFTELFKSHPIKAVFWNRRYEPASLSQDAKIKSFLKKEGVDCQSFNASLIYEHWTIKNKQGKHFQVFTQFYKNCLSQGMQDEEKKTGTRISIKKH